MGVILASGCGGCRGPVLGEGSGFVHLILGGPGEEGGTLICCTLPVRKRSLAKAKYLPKVTHWVRGWAAGGGAVSPVNAEETEAGAHPFNALMPGTGPLWVYSP